MGGRSACSFSLYVASRRPRRRTMRRLIKVLTGITMRQYLIHANGQMRIIPIRTYQYPFRLLRRRATKNSNETAWQSSSGPSSDSPPHPPGGWRFRMIQAVLRVGKRETSIGQIRNPLNNGKTRPEPRDMANSPMGPCGNRPHSGCNAPLDSPSEASCSTVGRKPTIREKTPTARPAPPWRLYATKREYPQKARTKLTCQRNICRVARLAGSRSAEAESRSRGTCGHPRAPTQKPTAGLRGPCGHSRAMRTLEGHVGARFSRIRLWHANQPKHTRLAAAPVPRTAEISSCETERNSPTSVVAARDCSHLLSGSTSPTRAAGAGRETSFHPYNAPRETSFHPLPGFRAAGSLAPGDTHCHTCGADYAGLIHL